MKFGIDISTWQGGIDLAKAKKEGVEFVIIRGAYTGSKNKSFAKDNQFEKHYKNAKANGLGVGVYHFSRACNYDEGIKEATYLYNNCLKGKTFEYPIYIDIEDTVYQARAGKEVVTQAIIGFCETLENFGYFVGVYANTNWFKNYIDTDKLNDYDKWIAYWGKDRPTSPVGGIWQFGGETNKIRTNKVAGYTCDQNYAYKDYPSIIKNAHLNGFTATKELTSTITPNEPKKSLEVIANEVIGMKWGIYPKRKILLEDAGYNYGEVQNKVNEILKGNKTVYYTVQKNDWVIKIANKCGVSSKQIIQYNNLKVPYIIHEGQKLIIKK